MSECNHNHVVGSGICEDCREIVFPALYFADDKAKTEECLKRQRAGISQKV